MAQHISRTLGDAERTLTEIAALKHGAMQRITIAGQESVIARFLPPALVQLHADYPDVSTSFKAANGQGLSELLSDGRADIALAFDPKPAADIEQVAQRRLPVGAVMTRAHPLAKRSHVSLSDCAQYPLILPDESWPLRELLDREIAEVALELNIVTSSNSVELLRYMLDQQVGIGFQTVVGIEDQVETEAFALVPLRNPDPIKQTFAICVRKERPDAAPLKQILQLLQRRLDDYAQYSR